MSSRRVLGLDKTPNYVGEDEYVYTIKLYYGGVLVVHPYLDYLGGKVEYFDYWPGDHGSMLGLRQMIKSLRYDDRKVQFWYKYGDCTSLKIRRIDRDKDVIDLNFEIPKNKEVEIIVEHLEKENWNYDVNVDYYIDEELQKIYERVKCHDNSKELEVESQKYASDGREENQFGATNNTAIEENQFGARFEEDDEMDYVISEDELRSLSSDSETESAKPSLVYREGDVKKPVFQLQVHMIFSNHKEFKWAVECYAAMNKRAVKFVKNEAGKVIAKCRVDHCKWYMYASRSNPTSAFTLKTIMLEHTCPSQNENKTICSGFLAKFYKEELKDDDKWGRIKFQKHVQRDLKCQVSKYQTYRAKKKAKAKQALTGTQSQQFELLRDYCEELKRCNPGSSVIIDLDENDRVRDRCRFKRLYICYAGCKEGVLKGCRPLIGVDGCHLKGYQRGGQLLSAVGVDANNGMYPIAFAVVEGELKESWKWFLSLLDNDLKISNNPHAWTFISDKQKGLLPVVDELFPEIEHRFCARHLHQNFVKDGFSGQLLKQAFWAVCKSTTEAEFKKNIDAMALLNPKAVEWLSERSPRHYCRAFFNTFIKCDMLLNNLCESYNSSILNARDKPILTMLESLRIHLMTRMQANRDKMRSHPFKICPKIMKIIEENKDKATEMRVYKSIGGLFQIEDGNVKLFKVDLSKHICSCRRWDLTGIPCSHAISAVWREGGSPEDYTHHCYTVESYLSTYEHAIMPITSSEMWPKTGLPPPLPPKYKAQPGRPKKLRKRDKTEKETSKSTTKLGKKGQKKRCSVCGKTGHNKSTCNKNKTPTTSSSQQVQKQIHRDENSITMVDEQGYQNSIPVVVQQVQQQFYGDLNFPLMQYGQQHEVFSSSQPPPVDSQCSYARSNI